MAVLVQMAVGELCPTIFSMCLHLFGNECTTMELLMNQMWNLFFHSITIYIVFQFASRCRVTFEPELLFFCVFYLISVPFLVAEFTRILICI